MAVALAALVSNVGRRWTASARTIEVVLDVHMCAAQPFLEQSIDQYASLCRNPHDPMHWVVELWDGSTMSSHEFLERVAKDKKLFGKGSWGPNADHSRMLFTPLKPGQTGVLPITKFLVLRHPSDLECAVSKMMRSDDDSVEDGASADFSKIGVQDTTQNRRRRHKSRSKRLLRALSNVFSFDAKFNENAKDARRIKDIVRQMAGISMIAAAQTEIGRMNAASEDDAKELGMDMLQAFKMLDIYDTSYFDSLFRKFKNWFTSEQESTAGREIFKGAMGAAACGVAAFSKTFSPECTNVLSTVASIAGAKLGLGTPSTYRVKALVEFVQTYLTNLQDAVQRFDKVNDKIYEIVNTATAQVQCVLQLFGAYYDFKSPVTMRSPDGIEHTYKIALGRNVRGFASEQLMAYNFKENIELTEAMIKEIERLQDLLVHSMQLLELRHVGLMQAGAQSREETIPESNHPPNKDLMASGSVHSQRQRKNGRRTKWRLDGRVWRKREEIKMCGIGSVLCRVPAAAATGTTTGAVAAAAPDLSPGVLEALARRGPDAVTTAHPPLRDVGLGGLCLAGAVLHLRGTDGNVVKQPIKDARGNWLLWNGEAYDCGARSDSMHVSSLLERFDAEFYSKKSNTASEGFCSEFAFELRDTMQKVLGPWAFIWWHARTSTMWSKTKAGQDGGQVQSDASPEQQLFTALDASVQRRVQNIAAPPHHSAAAAGGGVENVSEIGILFSGGLDCTVLAALAHAHVSPASAPIDLINVCFDAKSHASPDRQTAILSYVELCSKYPTRPWRLVGVDATVDDVNHMSKYITSLVYPSGSSISSGTTSQMDINIGTALWFAARGKGRLISLAEAQEMAVQFRPKVAQATKSMNATKTKSVDRSKNKKKKQKQKQNSTEAKSNTCNDGAGTGEAKTNVASSSENASSSCTVLSKFSQVSYQSPCRVLLSGLGADEYLAGYGRHRTAYRRGGAQELRRELILDAERLPERNHGRDDRCISDHAKEVRYPFLDEEVIRTVGTMSVETIAHMSLPRGQGEKRLLRQIAQNILDLRVCSGLPKRALQFGSRMVQSIEKENKRRKKLADAERNA
eukprot:g4505.t1